MTEQQKAAVEAMEEWLAHPAELGKAPSKIEIAGEFDRYEMHYYILKYKKSFLSPWLIGVCGGYEGDSLENCGHIFSKMEPYDPSTARDKAVALVDYVREYLMSQAKALEEKPKPGAFLGFILLSTPEWDIDTFRAALKEDWDIDVSAKLENESREDEDFPVMWFDVDEMLASAMLVKAPVPDNEAVANAYSNFVAKNAAVEAAQKHVAQLILTVLPDPKHTAGQCGAVFVMIASTCLKMSNALGIYANGTVTLPDYYRRVTEDMKEGTFPLLDLVFVGLTQSEDGISGYTNGLRPFGHEEVEIVNSAHSPAEIHDMLLNIASYIVNSGAVLLDGQTLGYTADQKLSITLSDGVNVNGKSLKIGF